MKQLLIAVLRRLFDRLRPETLDPWSDAETVEVPSDEPGPGFTFDGMTATAGGVRASRRTRPAARLTLPDPLDFDGLPPGWPMGGGGVDCPESHRCNRITRAGGFLAAPTGKKFPST